MKNVHRLLRTSGGIYLGVAVLGVSAAAAFAAGNPAVLPELGALVTSVACSSSSTACVTGKNSNSGAGVAGTSAKGASVLGTGTSGYGVKATSSSNYGVYGSSWSGTAGVVGTTKSAEGVYGYTSGTTGGTGVHGASYNGRYRRTQATVSSHIRTAAPPCLRAIVRATVETSRVRTSV